MWAMALVRLSPLSSLAWPSRRQLARRGPANESGPKSPSSNRAIGVRQSGQLLARPSSSAAQPAHTMLWRHGSNSAARGRSMHTMHSRAIGGGGGAAAAARIASSAAHTSHERRRRSKDGDASLERSGSLIVVRTEARRCIGPARSTVDRYHHSPLPRNGVSRGIATDLGERWSLVRLDRYITLHTVIHRYIPATNLGERQSLVGLRRDAAPRELAEPLRRRRREARAAVGERGGVARQV